jgi:hypothetical protein
MAIITTKNRNTKDKPKANWMPLKSNLGTPIKKNLGNNFII